MENISRKYIEPVDALVPRQYAPIDPRVWVMVYTHLAPHKTWGWANQRFLLPTKEHIFNRFERRR